MSEKSSMKFGRRDVLKTSVMALGGALLVGDPLEAYPKAVNTNSSPSTLKITDLRVATVVKPGPSPCPIIRIDTNQGVYGLGEVRDGASATYALFLKSRIVGENPLQRRQDFSQDQAVRRSRATRRRRLRHRNGALGHRRQGLQRSRLPDARAASSATRFASMPTPPNRTTPRSTRSA